MVIHNFDVLGAGSCPAKAQAILLVDANAVLASTIAQERFQAVAWRDTEVFQPSRNLQLPQLASRNSFDVYEPLG